MLNIRKTFLMIVMLTPKRTVGEKNIPKNTQKKKRFFVRELPPLPFSFVHVLSFSPVFRSRSFGVFFCLPKRRSLGFLPVGTPHPKSWPRFHEIFCPGFASVFFDIAHVFYWRVKQPQNRRKRGYRYIHNISYHTFLSY